MAEAELFGFEKGAFTGAERAGRGHLRAADGGTLFLDEIADLSLEVQAKLLRAIESGEVLPLGGTRTHQYSSQLVVACQVPLESAVDNGRFRADLASRLQGAVVKIPALRQRREDIPSLFVHFLRRSMSSPPAVSARAYETLCMYGWGGNVRQLELLARRILAEHGHEELIRRSHLPLQVEDDAEAQQSAPRTRREQDVRALAKALKATNGNVKAAAENAGISRQRAYRIMRADKVSIGTSPVSSPDATNGNQR